MARLREISRDLLNWDESKHPRDRLGRFTFSIGRPFSSLDSVNPRSEELRDLKNKAAKLGVDLDTQDGKHLYVPELAVQGLYDADEYGFQLPDSVMPLYGSGARSDVANYDPYNKRVILWSESPIFDVDSGQTGPDFVATKHTKDQWWAAGTPLSIVHHELAHAGHHAEVGDRDFDLLHKDKLPKDVSELIADEVSIYGTTNPLETVAEVAAGHMNGIDYSPDVYGVYYNYGGPFLKK